MKIEKLPKTNTNKLNSLFYFSIHFILPKENTHRNKTYSTKKINIFSQQRTKNGNNSVRLATLAVAKRPAKNRAQHAIEPRLREDPEYTNGKNVAEDICARCYRAIEMVISISWRCMFVYNGFVEPSRSCERNVKLAEELDLNLGVFLYIEIVWIGKHERILYIDVDWFQKSNMNGESLVKQFFPSTPQLPKASLQTRSGFNKGLLITIVPR